MYPCIALRIRARAGAAAAVVCARSLAHASRLAQRRARRRVLVVARTLRGAAAIDVCCDRLYTTRTINIANAPASLFTFLLLLQSSTLLLQHAPVDP